MKKLVWLFCAAGVTSLVALPFLFLVPHNNAATHFTNHWKWTDGKGTGFGTNGWPRPQTNATLDMITGDAPAHSMVLLGRTNAPIVIPSFIIREPATGMILTSADPYGGSIVITGQTIGTFASNRWQWADGIVLGVVTNQIVSEPISPPPGQGNTLVYWSRTITNRVLRFTLPNGESKELPF